jgi:uncharacterized RDD family membrane protein YckC
MERKGFGIRFGAYLIDVVIITVLGMVLVPIFLPVPIVGALLLLVIAFGYPVIEILQARSPGKMILGMVIMRDDGAPAPREQLIKRTLIKFSPSIVSNVLGAIALIAGTAALARLANAAGTILGIVLLVLSIKTLQTVKQAFWDVQAKTAVYGKPAVAAAGFQPVMPGAAPPVAPAVPPAAPPPPV